MVWYCKFVLNFCLAYIVMGCCILTKTWTH